MNILKVILGIGIVFLSEWAHSDSQKTMSVRVRVAEAIPRALVRGYDLHLFQLQNGVPQLIASTDQTSEWEIKCSENKKHFKKIFIKEKKSARKFEIQEPLMIRSPAGFLKVKSRPYRNELYFYSKGKKCDVVNEVNIEKYLDGLVNAEFSAQWNEEAIAAQVVAARTYAYYQILEARSKSRVFDVDATVKDQVYDGTMREHYKASRAVDKTRGLVLGVSDSKSFQPIKAFYHSTCGGKTELPENVWGSKFLGFKRSVDCPYCVKSLRFHWDLDLSEYEVGEAILAGAKETGPQPGWPKNPLEILVQGKLVDIRIDTKDPQKRVEQVIAVWVSKKEMFEFPISSARFRDWMGTSRFRSTIFQTIEHTTSREKKWLFRGVGNGHGVGMCQWGAKAMGEKGFKMTSILKHYYPDAELRVLW